MVFSSRRSRFTQRSYSERAQPPCLAASTLGRRVFWCRQFDHAAPQRATTQDPE